MMESGICMVKEQIYIPIWLDLLCWLECVPGDIFNYLHSNMVRFIIKLNKIFHAILELIYIPIWLDLL